MIVESFLWVTSMGGTESQPGPAPPGCELAGPDQKTQSD